MTSPSLTTEELSALKAIAEAYEKSNNYQDFLRFISALNITNTQTLITLAEEALAGRAEIERMAGIAIKAMERATEAEAELAAAREGWTDEHGTTWTPPTAWAYAQACRVMYEAKARADAAEARVRGLEEALREVRVNANSRIGRPYESADYGFEEIAETARDALALQPASEPSAPVGTDSLRTDEPAKWDGAERRKGDDGAWRKPTAPEERQRADYHMGELAERAVQRERHRHAYYVLEVALHRVELLMGAEPGTPEGQELDLLADLILFYERDILTATWDGTERRTINVGLAQKIGDTIKDRRRTAKRGADAGADHAGP